MRTISKKNIDKILKFIELYEQKRQEVKREKIEKDKDVSCKKGND
jgi:hypothetical protein